MLNVMLWRAALLILLAALLWGFIVLGRRFVERQRRAALAAPALATGLQGGSGASNPPVRILLFSSAECQQCHRLQKPALRQVQAARGDLVRVIEVDAPTEPHLTARYRVLTLPTTVVLDGQGKAQAVNYGFAPAGRLLAQIDDVLAQQQIERAAPLA
ncbi:MAG: thioredoxin family protein [Thermogemmatispora sp.]|jgi:thioredoxin-related protein|uniref:thioredoxin family protein n=1 Tax=Thermogemmatispora sp. TaxID=1968838 RepID=UPI0019F82B78|nr:thioredoxin family protein [Thermogemmatispora sp.]MBE3566406.1 thioredoxin family protein [Thermogemmatispora sp.]